MAETEEQERSEEATQQRREDFRRRGQVAQTRELTSVLVLLSTAGLLLGLGRFLFQQLSILIAVALNPVTFSMARSGDLMGVAKASIEPTLLVLMPFALMLFIIGVAATVLQTGLLYNEEALQLRWERLDPVAGFKRIFALRSFIEGFKSLLKLILIFGVVYLVIKSEILRVPHLISFSVAQSFSYAGMLTLKILGGIGVFMAFLASADYFFQRWELERQMRMTKQEIKEEHKTREGDPLVKARIRRIQREMANKRMMTDVKKADVVITNPTHIAVALQYDVDELAAPKVIAKGAGIIAEKIKELARNHSVPIVENKPLARTIYKTIKIGQMIPRELYTAVAQVLSYVYRLRRKAVQ